MKNNDEQEQKKTRIGFSFQQLFVITCIKTYICSNQAVYTFIMGHCGGDLYRLIFMAHSR